MNLPSVPLAVGLMALAGGPLYGQHEHPAGGSAPSGGAPTLYDNLGSLHREIRTTSPQAQRYFDQGLRLTYAFNHAEAIRSFQYAADLDPACAMCWWGIANALGPNINMPMPPEAYGPAYAAVQRARILAPTTAPRDQALIEAIMVRYSAEAPPDRSALDSAYAEKLRVAARRFPDDPDINALFAESLLDLRPWNQWSRNGTPQPGTLETVAVLEHGLAKNPNHPGLCHFYIHTVEGSPKPERALPCARRLADLMPGAGHLVHMPAHIAFRLGDYATAIAHNQHATEADAVYLGGPHTASIYDVAYKAHNWHFLSVAAAFAGRGALAIDAARRTAESIPFEVAIQEPAVEFWMTIPYFALVRFEKWDEMLDQPEPPPGLRYVKAMWHFGRGMAFLGRGDISGARRNGDSLAAIRAETPENAIAGAQRATVLLGIAGETLAGEIAAHTGDSTEAVGALEEAVVLHGQLSYDEPPPDYFSPRQLLGVELLRQGKPKQAEAVFRSDLKEYRENGWALRGLSLALKAQGRDADAAAAEQRLAKVWEGEK